LKNGQVYLLQWRHNETHLLEGAVGQGLSLQLLVKVVYVCTVVLAPAIAGKEKLNTTDCL